ncbi:hypothetical protein [Neobacillus sp. D3-1R]|uniref:hypothetical protein n=1 Tax=Neobacillus sp. D3-1R TaxID=3445778 RepID=UPI003FA0B1D6
MTAFTIVLIIFIFFYTAGYSLQLWKEKNKLGSISVFILALALVVTPFFTVLNK